MSYLLFIAILLTSTILAQETKEYEETYSFSSTGTVSVDTYKGSITVETWDKAEVYFYAKVEPDTDGWNSTSPEEQVERCKVRYSHSDNYLDLKTDYSKNSIWGSETRALVHYTIKMPATAKLKIEDYKSETRVDNLKSEIELETYKGRVRINNLKGGVDIETYKGDIDVDLTELTDNCSFDTYKGDINIYMPASSKFDFNFDLGKKGDFSSDFEMMMSRYNSDDGDMKGEVNGGGPTIRFSTYKGEIELREKK